MSNHPEPPEAAPLPSLAPLGDAWSRQAAEREKRRRSERLGSLPTAQHPWQVEAAEGLATLAEARRLLAEAMRRAPVGRHRITLAALLDSLDAAVDTIDLEELREDLAP